MKHSTRLFLKSFFVSSFVATVLVRALLLLLIPKPKPQEPEPISSNYTLTPTENDRFSILILVSKTKDEPPYCYFLASFDAFKNKISLLRLSNKTLISKEGEQKIILNELFKNKSKSEAVKALNQNLGINLSRYIHFDNDGFLNFVSLFKSTYMNVKSPLSEVDRKNDIYIKIDAGRTLFSALTMLDFLNCNSFSGGESEKLSESARLIFEFISQHKNELLNENSSAVEFILDKSQTDLSIKDIENRREMLKYLFESDEQNIFFISPEGEMRLSDTEFVLTQSFREKLKEIF